jgi:hypothetical protein
MTKQSEILKKLLIFIEDGNEISRFCSDHVIDYSDESVAITLHTKYMIWKAKVGEFLGQSKFKIDWKLFTNENAVPYLIGGFDYGFKDSLKSQNLIKAIRQEIGEKIKHLGEIYRRVEDTEIKRPTQKTYTFSLNKLPRSKLTRY